MKKTFVAVAVLGAFAGSAMAADVTLYGKIDLGLNYQNTKVDGQSATNKFQEYSGQNSGSRFGLKGTEDLGNGYKVGFVLENGFDADTGATGQSMTNSDGSKSTRLFGREAQLYVSSDFGTLSMGRVGALTSGLGSYNLNSYMAMSTGWGDYTSKHKYFGLDRDRMDNTVTYQTPRFAGVRVTAQYSFQTSGAEVEHTAQNDRYAAIGADYQNGAFAAGLVVDQKFAKNTVAAGANDKDELGVMLGASYDFEVVKAFALFEYAQNANKFANWSDKNTTKNEGVKGYMAQLGVTAPVLGGTAYATVNYSDADTEVDSKAENKAYGVGVGYTYPLSKRTYAYTYAGYQELKPTDANGDEVKTKNTEFGFGLVHNF